MEQLPSYIHLPNAHPPSPTLLQIRMMHVNTRRNLHSHVYSSHLSNGQEVSAYGENGIGDHGDDWIVTCSTGHWKRDGEVRFKHVQVRVFGGRGE